MANDLNIPRSTLSCWENGLRTPKIETIEKIANYFNVGMNIITKDFSSDDSIDNEVLVDLLKDNLKNMNEESKIQIQNIINNSK